MYPILAFDGAGFAYLDSNAASGMGSDGYIQSLAWYEKDGEIGSFPVIVAQAIPINTSPGKERALATIQSKVQGVEEDLVKYQQELGQIEDSRNFMNKEFQSNGLVLSRPLFLADNFVGYNEGGQLVRMVSSRYNIAQGLDARAHIIDKDKPSIEFHRKDKVELALDAAQDEREKEMARLRSQLDLHKKNIEIIETDSFTPPF